MRAEVALITGATNGIGQATAFELAKNGFRLIIHGRNALKLNKVGKEIESLSGFCPRAYVADFKDLSSVAHMCKSIVAAEPRIDVLINNAGNGFDETMLTMDGYDPDIQVNFIAPSMLMLALGPSLRTTEYSRIINVASGAQMGFRRPIAFGYQRKRGIAYARSKLALVAISRYLAEEWDGDGPAVLSINPGSMIQTPLSDRLILRSPWFFKRVLRQKLAAAPSLSEVANFLANTAAKRIGPELNGKFMSSEAPIQLHRQARDPIFRREIYVKVLNIISSYIDVDELSRRVTATNQQARTSHAVC